MPNESNFNKDISINPYELEEAAFTLPGLIYNYGILAGKARFELDTVQAELEVLKAQVEEDIRKNPDDYEMVKITESAISSKVSTDHRVIKKIGELNLAKVNFRYAEYAAKAMEAKKDALNYAIKLLQMNYYAGPEDLKVIDPGYRWVELDHSRVYTEKQARAKLKELKRQVKGSKRDVKNKIETMIRNKRKRSRNGA